MKKILACYLFCMFLSTSAFAEELPFNDIDGHWAESTICKWQSYGYIDGYPDGSFRPDDAVNRAELAKVLSLAFDLHEIESLNYSDVYGGEWYYIYLERAAKYIPNYALPTNYESNIPYRENEAAKTNGFLPDVYAIRMHVAEALVKIKIEKEDIVIDDLSIQDIHKQVKAVFDDPAYISLDPMHGIIPKNVERMNRYTWLAYNLNIMIGDDRYFYPYGYMTRAELLTAIDRMID